MKRIALDTNIAIELLNKNKNTIKQLEKFDIFYLPITVCGELLFGALNSKRKNSNEKKVRVFIKSCKILNSNTLIAEEYATIRYELRQKGNPIPENDIWIAAICKVNNLSLATRDKHFKNIDGLKIVKLFS
ncbi:MAG: type II toxin-antitoxin system VapC family toxin [Chitinophagales bacterium]